ncbi:undecaprenyl/decaprenyl-phosphate alpha-N-acetylglucosaminyl 1-phosphate transferase [Conexibacter sp. W3-3-2]|uniref:glycosyltransferase family 4 protein n=1 Tax=Conexibacter sp. W3-3-2 TaxID=2675227 RepID=UPI0012B7AABF|nr:MraY family glycosyltransferase [Conexibacter sp. W3-3-2]MTD46842.1 undecaprenyl/decaprenyl-phosphate alpha-N-acetylglucosaminyl 1-phosphate transferase [Conexibacter sp. W3-3-2]
MTVEDAILALVAAFVVAALATPLTSRLARAVGAVDRPRDRGLAAGGTPLLGGLAMLAAVLVAGLLFLDFGGILGDRLHGILAGAVVIALVGALDDRFDLHPAVKLLGQVGAASVPVAAGVEVTNITFPFLGAVDFGSAGAPLTVVGLVAVMNVVNLSDGIDGLAAGVCAIAAAAFAIIAFDLQRDHAGVLAAITCGAALGFLVHNFHPASAFMGDCGSNLLGLLLGCVAVEGAVKTQAILALLFPLVVLAVPFLDTTFVVLKRLKYRRPIYAADTNHFHHRFSAIGFSQRRTVLYLYAWTVCLAGFAVALRFVPYSDNGGSFDPGWTAVMAGLGLLVLAASVYLVYTLEILKFRVTLRRRTGRAAADVDAEVARAMETGEFQALRADDGPSGPRTPSA